MFSAKFYQFQDEMGNIFLHEELKNFQIKPCEKFIIEDDFVDVLKNTKKKVKLNEKTINFNIFIKPSEKKINKILKSLKEIFEKLDPKVTAFQC